MWEHYSLPHQIKETKMGFLGSIGSAIGGLVANPTIALGALGGASTAWQNSEQKKLAEKQMDFQQYNSNTAYQRSMKDMKKAGLNPILASKLGGASTPSGAMAQLQGHSAQAFQGMQTSSNITLQEFQGKLANSQKELNGVIKDIRSGDVPIAKSKEALISGLDRAISTAKEAIKSRLSDKNIRQASEAVGLWLDVAKSLGKNLYQDMRKKVNDAFKDEDTNSKVKVQ